MHTQIHTYREILTDRQAGRLTIRENIQTTLTILIKDNTYKADNTNETYIPTNKETDTHSDRWHYKHTYRHANIHTDRQTERQTII